MFRNLISVLSPDSEIRAAAGASRRPPLWSAFIVLPWLLGVIFLLHESCGYRDAATRQRMTPGIITAHEPGNHDRYGYSFAVAGRAYHGWQVPTGSEEWKIGQQVAVYYDAADPTKNSLTDFDSEFLSALGPLPFLIGGIISILTIIFFLRLRVSPGSG